MTSNIPDNIPDPHDGFDWDVAEAEVFDLDDARARRTPNRDRDTDRPETGADIDPDTDDADDAESFDDGPAAVGGPVDQAGDIPVSAFTTGPRKPVLATWARSWIGWKAACRWWAKYAGYVLAYHAVRSPKYAAKTAVYTPVGVLRGTGRVLHWATAEEGNWHLRQAAAQRGDADTWLKLDARRQRQSVWRWWILIGALVVLGVVVSVLAVGPAWWRWLAVAAAVPLLARVGRPEDKPITDRVSEGRAYRKLTAELVRRGLTSLGLAGINQAVAKDPKAISFPVDIHRDGPGHIAIVDLPFGVEATEVCARRGKLASALRLPLDQVWPEPAPGHTGRLALWVGYEPASQMRQPTWQLIQGGKVDVFKPFPFATTPRMEVVCAELMYRNWLFGGQPGSGKTVGLRDLVLAAGLDPRVELRGYNLKGSGDFTCIEPISTEYGSGFDDETLARCAAMFDWLYEECQRRAKKLAYYTSVGKAPDNKVTPELASLKGSGLHPLVVWVDEIQELFLSKWGKAAGEVAEKVIKLGRALGVILLIGTQIPDKDSLPTGITRNVNTRFCLSVADQTANDMILGTSAYKNGYRATVFTPVVEAGWGILVGLGKPGARRSFEANNNDADKIVARAIGYRQAAGTMPTAPAERDVTPGYDLLADLLTVWPAGEDKAWNETLLERLTELRPDVYAGWKPEQLTSALKPHGIEVAQIGRRVDGKTVNRRGPARADIHRTVTERNRKQGSD
jgi:S-DNA-T family DNA segregation ATPase FtsK/SpoIIIE